MTEASSNPAPAIPPVAPEYRDRRGALIFFGVVELFIAALSMLIAGLVVLGQLFGAQSMGTQPEIRFWLPAVALYGATAFVFATLGIGSIQCRRWARGLSIVVAWCWLAIGVVAVPITAWIMPKVLASVPGPQALSSSALTIFVVLEVVFMVVFFVVLPAGLVAFYSGRHVRSTCEARDPIPRWTDRTPLPLLLMACVCWAGSFTTLLTALTKSAAIPFFGTFLVGTTGAIVTGLMALLFAWLGWACYRRQAAGWWGLLGILLLFSVSSLVTFSRVDLIDFYRAMHYPPAQIDLIQRQGWLDKRFLFWASTPWVLGILAYLVWVKKQFVRP
jgi:hypothetical protein